MKPLQQFDFTHIINTLRRWKFLIIAVFIVISTLSALLWHIVCVTCIDLAPSSWLRRKALPATYVSSTVTLNVNSV